MSNISKIILGTVQFGLNYGVTNTRGKVSFEEILNILECAHNEGIRVLDTASTYGDSEIVLGRAFQQLQKPFEVVTKVYIKKGEDIHSQVFRTIEKSINDLANSKLYGVMAHHGYQILENPDEFVSALVRAKREFNLERIGVSVYSLDELKEIFLRMPLDLVQIPYNVFNQTFTESNDLAVIRKSGCEIHARSIFLQGALLSKPGELNSYFDNYKGHFNRYFSALGASGLSALDFNLTNALKEKSLDKIVLGVTTCNELMEIIDVVKRISYSPLPGIKDLKSNDEGLINPAKWKV